MQRLCTTKSEICETEQKTALSCIGLVYERNVLCHCLLWFVKENCPAISLDYERKVQDATSSIMHGATHASHVGKVFHQLCSGGFRFRFRWAAGR